MFSSMEQFFGKLMTRLDETGVVPNDPSKVAVKNGEVVDAQSVMQEMLKSNSPEQMKAWIDMDAPDNPEPLTKEELAEEEAMLAQEEKAVEEMEAAKPKSNSKSKKK